MFLAPLRSFSLSLTSQIPTSPDRPGRRCPMIPTTLDFESMNLTNLVQCWQSRIVTTWASHPEVYVLAGERFYVLGEPHLAEEVANCGMRALDVAMGSAPETDSAAGIWH